MYLKVKTETGWAFFEGSYIDVSPHKEPEGDDVSIQIDFDYRHSEDAPGMPHIALIDGDVVLFDLGFILNEAGQTIEKIY